VGTEGGDDPDGVLDPERLLHLEAALRRGQRRFDETLILLERAAAGKRYPGRALVSKGFTFEVMGEYEQAIEALLQAGPLVSRETDPRQENVLRLNLAINFCHVGRFSEAASLVRPARDLAADLGDEIDLIRIGWVEGRIAAGQGRTVEALVLLKEARRKFAAKNMSYDIALALLEEAVLLLEQVGATRSRS
jgi:tetratricopeptide (TPR) repeat protein